MSLYPAIEPYEHGTLDVGDGNILFWEASGNPDGKPALVLHGGPGSGCTPGARRFFDPAVYRIVLFDQRNCGRSRPLASTPEADLSSNTTWHLVADIELLREHLGVERWLVLGGSWGSVLGLAYAETHPTRVSEMILFGSPTGRHCENDWLFRGGLFPLFPEEWDRLVQALPEEDRAGDIVEAYHRRLTDPDPEVCRQAAEDWCLWESATPDWPPVKGLSTRYQDPEFALGFARLVTHYVRHNLWLEDGILLQNADKIAHIPGAIINGRYDFQSPIGNAYLLKKAWPTADLVIVGDGGHSLRTGGVGEALVRFTDAFRGQGSVV